jgi:hypothetical protein
VIHSKQEKPVLAVDGTYKVTMQSPRGPQDATLILAASGGALSGSWAGQLGSQPIGDGSVDGESAKWTVKLQTPMGEIALAFDGKVNGDKIDGTVQFGAFGSGTFAGSRA